MNPGNRTLFRVAKSFEVRVLNYWNYWDSTPDGTIVFEYHDGLQTERRLVSPATIEMVREQRYEIYKCGPGETPSEGVLVASYDGCEISLGSSSWIYVTDSFDNVAEKIGQALRVESAS